MKGHGTTAVIGAILMASSAQAESYSLTCSGKDPENGSSITLAIAIDTDSPSMTVDGEPLKKVKFNGSDVSGEGDMTLLIINLPSMTGTEEEFMVDDPVNLHCEEK